MMINPSAWSRFVDLLRATGCQAFAVSTGCFLFLFLASTKSFELPSRWIVPIVTLVGITSGMLAVMSVVRAICEWVYRGVPFVWKFVADTVAMRSSIATLNEQERIALLPHVRAKSQTFYLNPFTQQGGIPEALRLQALYAGLADKGIVEIKTTDPQGKNAIIRTTRRAWRLLKKF